jgi:DHA1 family bicyclomycin/chloramphenicol resistance-like MFS transporter
VSIAIIRDTYEGNRMARIMSFIMTIFILVPMIAPLLGQLLLKAYNWQAIFYFQLIFIGITLIWFHVRQNETLSKDKRIALSRYLFTDGVKEFLRYKKAVLYTITTGLIQGSFITYLGSAQQIFQGQYLMEAEFPYIFGGLAFAFGLSNMLNGFFVLKYGMLRLVSLSLLVYISSSLIYLFLFSNSPNPGIPILIGFLFLQFFTLGFIFGNLSALAMQPIGHIAGIGAAIFSFTATSMSVVFAIIIGKFIHDTALPLFAGFFIAGIAALALVRLSVQTNKQGEEAHIE